MMQATVIGAGLAGSEAAWQLACRGIEVRLLEMKPRQKSPAHKMDTFAELVCSNSLKAMRLNSAAGLLKAEMKAIGAVEISLEQADAVARVVLRNYPQVEGGKAPNPNPKWVGRDAAVIAKAAGIDVPDSCRLLIVDVKRDINHVFARVEQLMPVVPVLRAANVDEAIEWALILERGQIGRASCRERV